MKWMMAGLAASGALVYGLVFLAESQHETSEPADVDRAVGLVEEIDAAESPIEVATLDPVEVSNPQTAPPTVAEEPAWMADPWPAGVRFYQTGDYDQAVEALSVAVEEKEESAYRHYLLGLAFLKNGEPEGAAEELRRSLELGPGNVRALVNLGRASIALGDFDEARSAVDLALESDLDDADAWNVLGRVELGVKSLEGADAAFSKAVEKDPEHAYAWNNLAYTRIQRGEFESALTPALAATQSGLEVPYFFNNLGIVLEKLDDLDGARDAFARAQELGHPTAVASHARVDEVLLARVDTADENEVTEEIESGVVAAIEQ